MIIKTIEEAVLLELKEYIESTEEKYGTAPSGKDIVRYFIKPKLKQINKSKTK